MTSRKYFCRCLVPPDFLEDATTFAYIFPDEAAMVGRPDAFGWRAFECYTERALEFFESELGAVAD